MRRWSGKEEKASGQETVSCSLSCREQVQQLPDCVLQTLAVLLCYFVCCLGRMKQLQRDFISCCMTQDSLLMQRLSMCVGSACVPVRRVRACCMCGLEEEPRWMDGRMTAALCSSRSRERSERGARREAVCLSASPVDLRCRSDGPILCCFRQCASDPVLCLKGCQQQTEMTADGAGSKDKAAG